METAIFWFHLLTVLTFSLSIFSEFILRVMGRSGDVPGFPAILLGLLGILLAYTFNYFDYLYVPGVAHDAEKIFMLGMAVSTGVLAFGIIRIAVFLGSAPITIVAGSVATVSVLAASIVLPNPALFLILILATMTILLGAVFYLFYVIRRRMIALDRKWVALGYLIMVGIPIEMLEFLLIHNRVVEGYIPRGLLSYSATCLVLAVMVIRRNIIILAKTKKEATPKSARDFREEFGITEREWEVIQALRQGKSRRDIAEGLYISVRTVDRHLNNVYRKCDVRNPVELINLLD